jgi:thiosulfate dehydrogenase [quinone] large subunit
MLAAGLVTLGWLFLRRPWMALAAAPARATNGSFRHPAGSRKVGSLKHLPANSALATRDPRTGNPAVVIRLSNAKKLVAYDAICTHAGCTVEYSAAEKALVCPCHGSVYDPARNAAVLQGPAPLPLTKLKVAVDSKGNIWLV